MSIITKWIPWFNIQIRMNLTVCMFCNLNFKEMFGKFWLSMYTIYVHPDTVSSIFFSPKSSLRQQHDMVYHWQWNVHTKNFSITCGWSLNGLATIVRNTVWLWDFCVCVLKLISPANFNTTLQCPLGLTCTKYLWDSAWGARWIGTTGAFQKPYFS